MGVNVELRCWEVASHRKRASARVIDIVVDADDTFAGLLNKCHKSGRTPTLDMIDPYANTIFNDGQVKIFTDELPALRSHATSDAEASQLAVIEALAHRCLQYGEKHHLHFVGD